MKIIGVKAFPVGSPLSHRSDKNWLFLRLDTDAGISGYGEMVTSTSAFRLPLMARMLEELVDQNLLGHDPHDVETLYDQLYGDAGRGHTSEHTKQAFMSGIEMACWDIIGKDAGQPIYRLLGGMVHERVRAYTYFRFGQGSLDELRAQGLSSTEMDLKLFSDFDAIAERAKHYVSLGFTAVKIDPFTKRGTFEQRLGQQVPVQYSLHALEQAEATIRAIRDSVGTQCDILIGTHGQMTAAGAIRVAKRLEPYEPLWFEEPVPSMNVAEMAKVARSTCIPITTGERLTTKHDFSELIRHEAAAIFNFDLGAVGGLLEAKKIAGMAEAHYLQISPHVASGPLIAAASVQLAVCSPNFLIMEGLERFEGIYAEMLDPPLDWRDGYVIPSSKPGLGHELREEVLDRYSPLAERS